MEQKTVTHRKGSGPDDMWIYGPSAGDSYLASQCKGNSGLDRDLAAGWLVKAIWEDRHLIVFLMERR